MFATPPTRTLQVIVLNFSYEGVLAERFGLFLMDFISLTAPVSHRAEEVMNALKTKIGSEQFLKIQAATQQLISTKRQENRAKKAENVCFPLFYCAISYHQNEVSFYICIPLNR